MSLVSLFPQITVPVLRLWLLKSLIWMRQRWLLRLVFFPFSLVKFHSLLWHHFPEERDYLVSSGSVFMTFLSMLLKAEWGKSFKIPRPSALRKGGKKERKDVKNTAWKQIRSVLNSRKRSVKHMDTSSWSSKFCLLLLGFKPARSEPPQSNDLRFTSIPS